MALSQDRYDEIGADNGLFAPAYIHGNPASEEAVRRWNIAHLLLPPTSTLAKPPVTPASAAASGFAPPPTIRDSIAAQLAFGAGGADSGAAGATGAAPSGATGTVRARFPASVLAPWPRQRPPLALPACREWTPPLRPTRRRPLIRTAPRHRHRSRVSPIVRRAWWASLALPPHRHQHQHQRPPLRLPRRPDRCHRWRRRGRRPQRRPLARWQRHRPRWRRVSMRRPTRQASRRQCRRRRWPRH